MIAIGTLLRAKRVSFADESLADVLHLGFYDNPSGNDRAG
jgi:hypothetical protein